MNSRVDTAPYGVKTPTHWLVANWLGLEHGGIASSGKIGYRARIKYISIQYLQLRQTGDEDQVLPGRHSPAWCDENPNHIG